MPGFRENVRITASLACVAALGVALGACDSGSSDGDGEAFAELAQYRGEDRQEVLLDGALAEGEVVWYTTLTVNIAEALATAFEAAYPGITVDLFRTADRDLTQRVITEYRAGRHEADVITPSGSGPQIRASIGAVPWDSPAMTDYPTGDLGVDPEGREVAIAQFVRSFGYNTDRVDENQVPTQWEDLLDPRWRDRIVISNSPGLGLMMIGGLIDLLGEEQAIQFLERFSEQNPQMAATGQAGTVDEVVAGSADACICSVHTVNGLAAQGAPVAYSMLGDTYFVSLQTTMFPPEPQHPHAAVLFNDFLIAADGGQQVLKDNLYTPTHPSLAEQDPAIEGRTAWVLTDERANAGYERWDELFSRYIGAG
ncbi:MAG: extracellular solute-binding protein [Micromonosporaceae bacterium]|nr:extracellular solute-binding protein [Micromonosporaceae bacterium]